MFRKLRLKIYKIVICKTFYICKINLRKIILYYEFNYLIINIYIIIALKLLKYLTYRNKSMIINKLVCIKNWKLN